MLLRTIGDVEKRQEAYGRILKVKRIYKITEKKVLYKIRKIRTL